MPDDAYVLRSRDDAELTRLALQHRVWRAETELVLSRAGFGPGERLLDLGSGPGFLTVDLARAVGPGGEVLAVDRSPRFLSHLLAHTASLGLRQVRPFLADARELGLRAGVLDGVVLRWVLMFVAEPERVLAELARAIRPGGRLVAFEYAQFRSMSLWPRGTAFRRLFAAVHELIALSGGDADVGARLPSMLERAGFEVTDLIPVWRVGRPGSDLWAWLDATNENHGNLVEAGLLTADDLAEFEEEWRQAEGEPGALFTAPPLLATVAKRRGGRPGSRKEES